MTFAPPLVIGSVLGPAVIPLYRIPAGLGTYAQNVGWTAVHSFMTFFVEISATGDSHKLQRTFLAGSRITVALMLPIAVTVLTLGAPFIGRWIGADSVTKTATLIPWIAVIYLSPLLSPMSINYLTAMGERRPHCRRRNHAVRRGCHCRNDLRDPLRVARGSWSAWRRPSHSKFRTVPGSHAVTWAFRCGDMRLRCCGRRFRCALLQYLAIELIGRHYSLTTWRALFGAGAAGLAVFTAVAAIFASESDRSMILRLLRRPAPEDARNLRPQPDTSHTCAALGKYFAGGPGSLCGPDTLRKMVAALRHRGPDDEGVWLNDDASIGLAHTRLAIIDLSPAGRQPMISASGRFALSFNGEIYNYRDLAAELAKDGFTPRGHSDTEVFLAGCERWGIEATLRRAAGMFALAIVDRSDRTLTLARDRLGEKPLYLAQAGSSYLFASETSAPSLRCRALRAKSTSPRCDSTCNETTFPRPGRSIRTSAKSSRARSSGCATRPAAS